jgi:hypothetical protein
MDQAAQDMALVGLQKIVSQTTAGDKTGADALPAGFHAQSCGQMGFAGAAFTQENDVPPLTDIFSGGQLMQQASVQTRGGLMVKHLHGLQEWKLGLPETPFQAAFPPHLQLNIG